MGQFNMNDKNGLVGQAFDTRLTTSGVTGMAYKVPTEETMKARGEISQNMVRLQEILQNIEKEIYRLRRDIEPITTEMRELNDADTGIPQNSQCALSCDLEKMIHQAGKIARLIEMTIDSVQL